MQAVLSANERNGIDVQAGVYSRCLAIWLPALCEHSLHFIVGTLGCVVNGLRHTELYTVSACLLILHFPRSSVPVKRVCVTFCVSSWTARQRAAVIDMSTTLRCCCCCCRCCFCWLLYRTTMQHCLIASATESAHEASDAAGRQKCWSPQAVVTRRASSCRPIFVVFPWPAHVWT